MKKLLWQLAYSNDPVISDMAIRRLPSAKLKYDLEWISPMPEATARRMTSVLNERYREKGGYSWTHGSLYVKWGEYSKQYIRSW